MRAPCAIRIFSESCPATVSTFCRLDRLSVILGKTLLNCEICLMNKASFLAFIFLFPFGADGGELRNTYYWYCPRCHYRYDRYQTMDEIIENRVPERPSYDSRNCADAHGNTYCYWALRIETKEVDLDEITKYRERKDKMRRIKEGTQGSTDATPEDLPSKMFDAAWSNKIINRSFNDAMWKAQSSQYFRPSLTITNESTEKVKNFNTDLVAPVAPFEVLKK